MKYFRQLSKVEATEILKRLQQTAFGHLKNLEPEFEILYSFHCNSYLSDWRDNLDSVKTVLVAKTSTSFILHYIDDFRGRTRYIQDMSNLHQHMHDFYPIGASLIINIIDNPALSLLSTNTWEREMAEVIYGKK